MSSDSADSDSESIEYERYIVKCIDPNNIQFHFRYYPIENSGIKDKAAVGENRPNTGKLSVFNSNDDAFDYFLEKIEEYVDIKGIDVYSLKIDYFDDEDDRWYPIYDFEDLGLKTHYK